MSRKIKLAIIYGSNREGRFCDVVVEWALSHLNKRGDFEVRLIDPAKMDLPPRMENKSNVHLNGFSRAIEEADAFLVVTPEYNHGYPAVLKFLIDSEYEGWRAKPVAFISYGGVSGGIRAVEQLRQVFAEVHTVTVRSSVSLINAYSLFDSGGQLIEPESIEKSLFTMLHQLKWWAEALREARAEQPYTVSA